MSFFRHLYKATFLIWCMILYVFVHTNIECFFKEKFKFLDVVYDALVKSNFFQSFTSLVLILVCGLWTISTIKDRNISTKRLILDVLGVEILVLADIGWNTPHFGFSSISLFSFVAIILTLDVLICCLKWLAYQNYDDDISLKNSFIVDNYDVQNVDKTRERYAELLLERLRNVDNKDDAFSLVVYGRWGSGKTLFLNYINNLLKQQNDIVINFNPWNSLSSKQMLINFFDKLSDVLSQYDSSLEKPMVKYADLLTSLDMPKPFDVFASSVFGKGDTSIDDLREKIRYSLNKIGISIYIIIDDLDRLTKSEILDILCLIRNTASFPYLKYIVACDRNHIIAQLKELNITPNYLEKIFMMELLLPKLYEDFPCVNKCRDAVLSMTDDVSLTNFFGLIATNKSIIIEKSLGNLRQAERFARSLVLNWEQVKRNTEGSNIELSTSEFIWLELICIIDSDLYETLYSNPSKIFDVKKNRRYEQNMYVLKSAEELTKMIGNKCSVDILNTIFPFNEYFKVQHNSISLLENYDKYFSLGQAYGHISKSQFLQILNTDSLPFEMVKLMDGLSNKQKESIYNMLLMLDCRRLKTIERKRYIDIVLEFCRIFNEKYTEILIDRLPDILNTKENELVKDYFLSRLSNIDSYRQILSVNIICTKLIKEKREKGIEIMKEDELQSIVQSNYYKFIKDDTFDAAEIVNSNTLLYNIVKSSVVCYNISDVIDSEEYNVYESLIHKQIIASFEHHKSKNIQKIKEFEEIKFEDGMSQEYFDALEEKKSTEICELFGSKANYEDYKMKCFERI